MKNRGAFNREIAPALRYTPLEVESSKSMNSGLSLEKKINVASFLDHFLRKFEYAHEIPFF